MNILITGATGFVGSEVVKAALEAGHRVAAMVRVHSAILPAAVSQIVTGDFAEITAAKSDLAMLNQAFTGIDVVVHTAARVHVMHEKNADPAAIYRLINVALTQRLATAAASAGVKRFVFISSVKVNGESTTGQPFAETDLPAPKDEYGQSKWAAEQILSAIWEQTTMEVVILRPPLIYGPGVKGNFANLLKLVKTGLPLPLGAVNNARSMLALDNLVSVILLVMKHPSAANQTYLVCDGEDVSTTTLLRKIAAAQGKKIRLLPLPVSWIQALARLSGKSAFVDRLLESLEVDSTKIRQQLGWQPITTMQQQLAKVCSVSNADKK